MKKFFKSLIIVILSVIMAVSVACKNKGESGTESTPKTESNSIETTPNQSTPDDGGESIPEDEKHLGDEVIDILNPILGNDFINFSMTLEVDSAPYVTAFTAIDAYVKNTDDGYDAIINTRSASGQNVMGSDIYYIDGVAVTGSGAIVDEERVDWRYGIEEIGTFDEVLDIFVENFKTNSPDKYEAVSTMVGELKTMLDEADLKNVNEIFDFDFAETLNQALEGFFALEEVPVYDFILSIAGVDLSDPTSQATVEEALNDFYEYLETNPTVEEFVNSIIDGINANRPIGEQINLETVIDEIQAQLNMSTAEIVAGIKSTSAELDEFFRDANQTESLYEYLDSHSKIIKVNKLSELIFNEDVSFVDVVKNLVENFKQTPFKQFFNNVVGFIVANNNGNQGESGVENGEIGEENAPTVKYIDYFGLLKSYNLNFQVCTIRGETRTDNVGRPTAFDLSLRLEFAIDAYDYETEEIVAQENEIDCDVSIKISYVKPAIRFEIPQEILDKAVASGGEVEEI